MAGKAKKKGEEVGVGYVSLYAEGTKLADQVEEQMDKAGKKAGKEGGKKASKEFKKELGSGLKKAGAAAGAAAAAGIAMGFNDALGRADLPKAIMAQTDISPEDAERVASVAGDAYAEGWGQSLEDLGKQAAALNQAIGKVGNAKVKADGFKNMGEHLQTVTSMAKTFDQDATQIITTAESMVKNGLAPSMGEALGVLTVGFQQNTKMSEDLLDSFDEYGDAFQLMGLDAKNVLSLMAQGLDAGGWQTDTMADALREYTIKAREMGEDTAAAYESIGMSAESTQERIARGGVFATNAFSETITNLQKMEDPAARYSAIVSIFGTKAEEMNDSLANIDPTRTVVGLDNVADATGRLRDNSLTTAEKLAGVGRTMQESLGAALETLIPQMEFMAGVGSDFFRWLAENPRITQIIMGVGIGLAAVAAAQVALNAAMALSPVAWVIMTIVAVIGLAVAAGIWLHDNWADVTWGMEIAWVGIQNKITEGINFLIRRFNDLKKVANFLTGSKFKMTAEQELKEIPKRQVPGLATGGTVTRTGTVLVGEEGPELLKLPAGASVVPLDHPAARAGSGGPTVNLTLNNPVAERSSTSLYKTASMLGASFV